MSTKDISTLETTAEWAAAITKTFQRAVREAVLENARLGFSGESQSVDLLSSVIREGDEENGYRAGDSKSSNPERSGE